MKKVLYYAIRTHSYSKPVIAVTSEKRHRWYGREVRDNMSTNGTLDHLKGRFDNVEAAVAMRESIGKLTDSYDALRKQLSEETSRLYRREGDAIERLLRDEDPGPVPTVATVGKQWIASSNCEWVSRGRRSLNTSSHTSQMAGACARAAEDINQKAGGFIVVRPEPEEVVR